MRFKVWRSGKGGKDGRYEVYELEPAPGMNLLEALFAIQDKYDDGLSFRYACRGAVCGSCAMTVNREPRLACRTQLAEIGRYKPMNLVPFGPLMKEVRWDTETEVLVEPLPVLPILRDLVVDMTLFYERYNQVRPWHEPQEGHEGFSQMTPEQAKKVDRWANCILCGACFGACPVCDKNPRYMGPAALAWSLRFIDDARAKDAASKLALVSGPDGAPACESVYNCVKVCPKDVAPAAAIKVLMDKLRADHR